MPTPSNPPRLTNVLGYGADISTIPATTPSGSGAFSYQSGFPAITAIPLTAGGIAPAREDFNAVIKLMSQHLFFLQSGSLYTWNSALDYLPGAHILGSNGQEYVAVQSSGPDTSAKAQNPVNDTDGTYWKKTNIVQLSSAVNSTSETTAATSKAVKLAYDKASSAYEEATTEASTSQAGRVQLSDSVSSNSSTTAATSKAVKAAWDKAVAAAGEAQLSATWRSGASWYRVWSDGFIEQGGLSSDNSDYTTITLPKAFTTTEYNVVFGVKASKGSHYATAISVQSKTTFTACRPFGLPAYWIAMGY